MKRIQLLFEQSNSSNELKAEAICDLIDCNACPFIQDCRNKKSREDAIRLRNRIVEWANDDVKSNRNYNNPQITMNLG